MEEVDINSLVSDNYLFENLPDNITIIGKIDKLKILYKYNKLDLSKIECKKIVYHEQEGESIKNHILPNSLKILDCSSNGLTLLPKLPNSLKELICWNNKLTELDNLPINLLDLICGHNKITFLPQLPDSLRNLECNNNKLKIIPDLPNSLRFLLCSNNQLKSLPDFSHLNEHFALNFYQDLPISYIPYNPNLWLTSYTKNKIIIKDYPNNPIINQKGLNKYMKYLSYKTKKSARK